MAARHEKGWYEKKCLRNVRFDLQRAAMISNDAVGVALGGAPFPEIRPGAALKTGDFVKEILGGLPLNDSNHIP